MEINLIRNGKELWLQIEKTTIPIVDEQTFETGSLPNQLVRLGVEEFIIFKSVWFVNQDLIKSFKSLYHIYRNGGDIQKSLSVEDQENLLKSNFLLPDEREILMRLWGDRNTPPKNRNKGESYIYLMLDSSTGLTKIGYSTNPRTRESTLQSEKPSIKLLSAWQGTYAEERLLHKNYAEKRVRGEWFSLTEDDIRQIEELFSDRTIWGEN